MFMEDIDKSFSALQKIEIDFQEFCAKGLHITEADTRFNIIDRIITEVLHWPHAEVRREVRASGQYLDYLLNVNGKKYVCLEAKKVGNSFTFPTDYQRKNYKISGSISKEKNISEAINQVRTYCDESAIRYAIVTNGYTWIIFRAIREDMPWKDGSVRVFNGFQSLMNSFIEFWNLISYSRLSQRSLDSYFTPQINPERSLTRVLNKLVDPDVPLLRNSLHTELHPIIRHFFEDIVDPEYLDKLEKCYVYSTTIKTVANNLGFVIKDSIPKFLADDGTTELLHRQSDAGEFGKVIEKAVKLKRGQLFLLLGGIGAGKTTFQKRFQLTVGRQVLEDNAIWFSIDFLTPPTVDRLEEFVWRSILTQLRQRYQSPHLETRQNIKRAFSQDILALQETDLYGLQEGSKLYEEKLNTYLAKWQSNLGEYVPKLLSTAKPRKSISTVLFFDNVDQLDPPYQAQIFLLAQHITDIVESITVIALREESYYTASVQKVFTAYVNRRFHIASPPFRKMISLRINYVLRAIEEQSTDPNSVFGNLNKKDRIVDLLRIVEQSIFEKSKNIAHFIDHLCYGNMRLALQMFSAFLVSGATDVDKMLKIYRRDGSYYVAFHEFLRSIMLGDRYFYKGTFSSILNLFECGAEINSSHFTALRVLYVLDIVKNDSSKEGEGYFEIERFVSMFDDIFNNKEDLILTLNRLVAKQLIEVNTKITESIIGSSHLRITSSGWYYYKYLCTSFAYLDLVFQDTPINSSSTFESLVTSMYLVNNLSDPEEDKVPRMKERFKRVEIFLNYLKAEEDAETIRYNLAIYKDDVLGSTRFMPKIIISYEEQKAWIKKRIEENREKFDEDYFVVREDEFLEEE